MEIIQGYKLISELGRGQFGVVYKATKLDSKQTFAVKELYKKKFVYNEVLKKLFHTEVDIMKSTNHPNVLHLYDLLETHDRYFMVVNFCNNGDLEDLLKKKGHFGEKESIFFLM